MPVYRYQAIDKEGRHLDGVMPAHDESNLDHKLKNFGLWLLEAAMERPLVKVENMPREGRSWLRMQSTHMRRELIDFCTLMTFQIRVGIPLVRALESACQDCPDEKFRNVLTGLQNQIESGLHFYEALGRYPKVFSTHFISVIRAGELSSKLPESFDDLRAYLEWVEQVVADVRQATLYPAIVITIITGFVLFLFSYIIPKFAALLSSLHVQQPLLTRIVFALGGIVKGTWFIWLPALLAIIIGVPLLRRYSPRFALAYDGLKLKLPIFGELNHMLALSRFTHNLAILYRAGLPILQAIELCKRGLIGNVVIERAVAEVSEDVKTGSTIAEAMHRQACFTAMLQRMVAMGETTGSLDHALENVSKYYNEVIPRRIKATLAVLEPLLMVFLIFLVGAVALAIYLPIIALMGSIK